MAVSAWQLRRQLTSVVYGPRLKPTRRRYAQGRRDSEDLLTAALATD
jgi:hypothetical protein